jgi:hypothetical protein
MTHLAFYSELGGGAAFALAVIAAVGGWYNAEGRSLRRGLAKVLKGEVHALIVARGRGRGAGINFASRMIAVAWDSGAWCLLYHFEELLGVELIVDGLTFGRAAGRERRRALDALGNAEQHLSVRLVFDDPRHPDFVLDLWNAARRTGVDAVRAAKDADSWLARIEPVLRGRRPAKPAPARQAWKRSAEIPGGSLSAPFAWSVTPVRLGRAQLAPPATATRSPVASGWAASLVSPGVLVTAPAKQGEKLASFLPREATGGGPAAEEGLVEGASPKRDACLRD